MAFLLKDSPECTKSELNLFSPPPTQTVIEKGHWVQYHPVGNVSEGGPVEFIISGSGEDYLDLSQTLLLVRAKIVKGDGTAIVAADKVAPVNLTLHSMFSQVDLSLNGRTVSSSNNTYAYRAMIETLLNHGYDSKTSRLSAEGYFKDTAGKMDVLEDTNEGYKERASLFGLGKAVDMMGRLHLDLFNQDRLLLNLVDLNIKLTRSKSDFCLMAVGNFKLVIEHASMFVRKVRTNPAVILGHAKALEKTTAKYPIDRVVCKVLTIPRGNMSFVQDNVFSGQMPKRLVIACVGNDAFNGSIVKSPFNFKHFDMNFLGVYVDGQPAPHQPLELDFTNSNYMRAFQNLFLNSDGIYINRDEFADVYCLFVCDLSPDLCDGDHFNLIHHRSQ